MSDRTISLSELSAEGLMEVGAGRPRTVHEKFPSLPILRVADVLDGKIDSQSSTSVLGVVPAEEPKISRPGDIVLTVKGTVGRVALMPGDAPIFAYSPQLCYFRPAADGPLRSRYLYYWFKSAEFWSQADALKGQTDMADYLSLSDVQGLKMRLPPLGQQDGIIGLLGALDDKIAVNDRVAVSAHELGQAINRDWHADSASIRLTEVAQVTMGSSPPGESYNEDGVGLPFYQGTRDFGDRFPGLRVWCNSPVRTAEAESCLLSVRAPVGRINIAREKCCIGRGLAAVRSKYGTPSALFHELTASSDLWLPYESEGTVFGAINKGQLENVEIKALAAEPAGRLESVLKPLDDRVAAAFDESQKLAELRDTLLPKLMSGQIRVRDAEKVVEDAVLWKAGCRRRSGRASSWSGSPSLGGSPGTARTSPRGPGGGSPGMS